MELVLAILGVFGVVVGAIGIGLYFLSRKSSPPSIDPQILEQLSIRFRSAASEALQANQETLNQQARLVVENAQKIATTELQKEGLALQKVLAPLQATLGKLESEIKTIEQARVGAYSSLNEQLRELSLAQKELKTQAGSLVAALREPKARGSWGELQLKRAVEFAGMTEYVDFHQQVSSTDINQNAFRPDMTIRMPNGRVVVVDAKVPMKAYMDAMEEKNLDQKLRLLAEHAKQLRDHFKKLGQKEYHKQFETTPEFVVLFLNMESSLVAALETEPQLIEEALTQKVIIATPTTLIALLKSVAYGWSEAKASDNAKLVVALGKELLERFNVVAGHWQKVGKSLNNAVEAYNEAANSTQSRLLVTARKLDETKLLNTPDPISQRAIDTSSTLR